MGGFFGVASKEDCVLELFYGVDYHSHLDKTHNEATMDIRLEAEAPGAYVNDFNTGDISMMGYLVPEDTENLPTMVNLAWPTLAFAMPLLAFDWAGTFVSRVSSKLITVRPSRPV